MNLNRYTFDVNDLDAREVFSETAERMGVLFIGGAIGSAITSRYLLSRLCIKALTGLRATLLGDGCEPARLVTAEYFLTAMGIGVALVAIGMVTAIVWRDD